MVYARRLPILRPRPFTPRGAGSRGRDRAQDHQSLRTNQSPPESRGRLSPRGRDPDVSRDRDTPVTGPLHIQV